MDNGAPRGDPADMPEIDLADREWSIGIPDLTVSSPSMTIPAVAPDFYAASARRQPGWPRTGMSTGALAARPTMW